MNAPSHVDAAGSGVARYTTAVHFPIATFRPALVSLRTEVTGACPLVGAPPVPRHGGTH